MNDWKLKFNGITLIGLVFFLVPLISDAQTRGSASYKIQKNDKISLKKKRAYQNRRELKKRSVKSINKKTKRRFHQGAKDPQSRGQWGRKQPRSNWSVILGGLSAVRPKYKGSDQYDFSGLPFIDIKYKKIFFLNFREGLGVNVLHAPNFRAGIALNFYGSRDAEDSNSLQGLQDIDAGLDAGAFGSVSIGRLSAKLKLRQDVSSNHNGLLFSGRLGYKLLLIKKLLTNINLRVTFADDNYMKNYFGITSAQSSSSGLREFNAGSGIKNVSGGANFIYLLDRHWSVISFIDYSRLLNDAASSPLVKDLGSNNQFFLGFGVGYKF
jgi:MipA family protein